MSLISKQIDELRAYAKDRKGELAKPINDAADTIEMLSAKLHASQMERSSQYYHGGWIPVSEKAHPTKEGKYLVTDDAGGMATVDIDDFMYCDDGSGMWLCSQNVTAWMPLPEPYREEGEQDG